jgi:hypothetical protein
MAYTDGIAIPHGIPSSLPAVPSNKGADLMVLKVASVLSTSYSDNDFRDAIFLADERLARGSARTRRLLRLDLLREAIDCNGEIIEEMGGVVEVCQVLTVQSASFKLVTSYTALETYPGRGRKSEFSHRSYQTPN